MNKLILFPCLALIFLIYGSIPYFSLGHLGIVEWQAGFAQSLAIGDFLAYPSHMGYPAGAPIVFGASFAYLQAILIKLFGLNPIDSYGFVSIIFLSMAFYGAAKLTQRLGAGHALSYIFATAYLSSPFILLHNSYAALAYGMALLPAYALIASLSFERVLNSETSTLQKLAYGLSFALVVIFALFLEGYTYVMFAMLSMAFILPAYLAAKDIGSHKYKKLFHAGLLYVASFGFAYLLMKLYIPALEELRLQSADVFRSMGLDLYFVLNPASDVFLLAKAIGYTVKYDALIHYGDASLAAASYLGISIITVTCGLLYSSISAPQRIIISVLLVASFFLSLGPSLKYDSRRLDINQAVRPDSAYSMPKEAAVFSFGIDHLYETVPGIKNMRATYRWHALTFFFIWFLSVSFFIRLRLEGNSRWSFFLIAVFIFDRFPDVSLLVDNSRKFYTYVTTMTHDVIEGMAKYIQPGEIVYFWPSGNDFFVSYAAPLLKVRAYNVGGDKNMDIARASWPLELHNIENDECPTHILHNLFNSGKLDVVVAPKFDMMWDVTRPWPLDENIVRKHEQAFMESSLNNQEFEIIDERYFYIIRNNPKYEIKPSESIVGRNLYFNNSYRTSEQKCIVRKTTGFSQPESWGRWTDGNIAHFELDYGKTASEPLYMEIEWYGFVSPKHPKTSASVLVMGKYIDKLEFEYGSAPLVKRIALPNAISGTLPIAVDLIVNQPHSPKELGLSLDARKLGVSIRRICIVKKDMTCSD
jgi:hypothetical protein